MSTIKKHTATTTTTLSIGEIVFELPTGKIAEAYSLLTYLTSLRVFRSEYAGSYTDDHRIGSVLIEAKPPALKIEIKPEVHLTEDEFNGLKDEYYARIKAERETAVAAKEAGK